MRSSGIHVSRLLINIIIYLSFTSLLSACGGSDSQHNEVTVQDAAQTSPVAFQTEQAPITLTLFNYQNQLLPEYIHKDNSGENQVTDEGATLGRVLFYDKKLSSLETLSCASCHQQSHAFSDIDVASIGVNGTTARSSMRLVNARFADRTAFFWDGRAESLETQTTMPVEDHVEMGFSGTNGDPDFNTLIDRLSQTDYYTELFTLAFGDAQINKERIQLALAQFVRSIQSFDAKYDEGRTQVHDDNINFPNFTADENAGKRLFLARAELDTAGNRIGGGAGCAGCHRPPEFDIDPDSNNNGVTTTIDGLSEDITITKSPTLRDVVNQQGDSNGPMMHNGTLTSLNELIDHYDDIQFNPNLDNRLQREGNGQRLFLTPQERIQLGAFLRTLTGNAVYSDEKWSDPFDENGVPHWTAD